MFKKIILSAVAIATLLGVTGCGGIIPLPDRPVNCDKGYDYYNNKSSERDLECRNYYVKMNWYRLVTKQPNLIDNRGHELIETENHKLN